MIVGPFERGSNNFRDQWQNSTRGLRRKLLRGVELGSAGVWINDDAQSRWRHAVTVAEINEISQKKNLEEPRRPPARSQRAKQSATMDDDDAVIEIKDDDDVAPAVVAQPSPRPARHGYHTRKNEQQKKKPRKRKTGAARFLDDEADDDGDDGDEDDEGEDGEEEEEEDDRSTKIVPVDLGPNKESAKLMEDDYKSHFQRHAKAVSAAKTALEHTGVRKSFTLAEIQSVCNGFRAWATQPDNRARAGHWNEKNRAYLKQMAKFFEIEERRLALETSMITLARKATLLMTMKKGELDALIDSVEDDYADEGSEEEDPEDKDDKGDVSEDPEDPEEAKDAETAVRKVTECVDMMLEILPFPLSQRSKDRLVHSTVHVLVADRNDKYEAISYDYKLNDDDPNDGDNYEIRRQLNEDDIKEKGLILIAKERPDGSKTVVVRWDEIKEKMKTLVESGKKLDDVLFGNPKDAPKAFAVLFALAWSSAEDDALLDHFRSERQLRV